MNIGLYKTPNKALIKHCLVLSFSFPELRDSLLEFNYRKNCQHWTNWMRWNKRDKVWISSSSATLLFKWHFRSRRRRCCLTAPPPPRKKKPSRLSSKIVLFFCSYLTCVFYKSWSFFTIYFPFLQVKEIERHFRSSEITALEDIRITTIDSFQVG